MVGGIGGGNAGKLQGVEIGQSIAPRLDKAGAAAPADATRDRSDSATDPQHSKIWNDFQAKFGEKPKPAREIKKTLDKDDFMRIMISQMKNQDPTEPFKAEQFASELAQYATVEQLHNLNKSMEKLTTQNQPLERLAMTNMIGKTVTIDRERFPHTEGQKESLSFPLSKDAEMVVVQVVNEMGEPVFSKELGPQKAGPQSFVWDGLKSNTMPAKTGTYMLKVAAVDAKGAPIESNPVSEARVIGVSYEGSEPVFLVGDPVNPQKVTMKNIGRIVAGGEDSGLIPGAKSLAAASAPQPPQAASQGAAPAGETPGMKPVAAPLGSGANFFTFKKGEGSSNLDPSSVTGAAREAMEKLAQARSAAPAQADAPGEEKGFPSGLSASGSEPQANPRNSVHDSKKGGE